MSRRAALHAACALLIAAPLSGCWVIDELDRGQDLLDKHSANRNVKARQEQEESKSPVAAAGEALEAYFRSESEDGTSRTITPGQVSEGIVACKLDGSTQFMKREDCAARGGHEG